MLNTRIKKQFVENIKGKVSFDRNFKERTYFKIGGPATAWVEPTDFKDLQHTLLICGNYEIPVFLFGSGSNLLVNDRGVNKVIIELSRPFFAKVRFHENLATVRSGAFLSSFINSAVKKGLGGLEFLAGIPGSVGGALAMNAGSAERGLGNFVDSLKAMDYLGSLKELKKKDLVFGYRESNLSDKIILEATFELKKSNLQALKKKFEEFLNKKRKNQNINYPNAGCIFKNPELSGRTAGQLLEEAGLKGKKIGDAQFSEKHANFIVNLGDARFNDVTRLIEIAQGLVKKKFDLWLEPEVKIIN